MVVPNDAALLSGLNIESTLGSLIGLGSSVVTLTGQASTGSTGSLTIADVMGLTGVSCYSFNRDCRSKRSGYGINWTIGYS